MNITKLVIGVVGEKGAGKATFARLLQATYPNKQLTSYTYSKALLVPTLEIWNLPSSRENLQKIAIIMEEEFGAGTVATAMFHHLQKDQSEVIVIDGVRWNEDYDMIRRFVHNRLVYITAPLELRYERTKRRKEKVGEDHTSFEQFKREELAKNELLIPEIGKKADFKIENVGSLEQLQREVDTFCKDLVF